VSSEDKRERLLALREEALNAGSEAAVERQHAKGKLTARERLELLLDTGSFTELDMFTRPPRARVRDRETSGPGATAWSPATG